jgi:threonine synthase
MSDPKYIDPVSKETFPIDTTTWRAPSGRPLMMTPLPGITREQIDQSERSIWRYGAAMPMHVENPVSMGEGCTPLHPGQFKGYACAFKLEWFSPTGSFKDRGASALISMLKQMGVSAVLEDSSGNGGAAIAGYGAMAGMDVKVFVPASTSIAKVAQAKAYGADIVRVPGPREATEAAAIEMSNEIFYASHNWHPFFLHGTKTLGYEIWEDLGFRIPDNIVIPAAAGSNLLGCYLAFTELMASGEIDRLPRLFVSQPENVAPLHTAFQAGADDFVEQDFASTVAEGTAIKRPIRLREMLQTIRESNGGTVAVSEDDIIKASLSLARDGIYVEPTCAHAAAGFAKLVEGKAIVATDDTVVILTGTGLKTTQFYVDQLGNDGET